jgi:hypothetical protein
MHRFRSLVLTLAFALVGTSTAVSQTHLPFDFVVESTDVNGWALNPKWGAQIPDATNLPDPYKCPGLAPWAIGSCTSTLSWMDQSSWKCPSTAFQYVWFPGHINFGGAVVSGTIAWSDRSGNDDDYNLALVPDGGTGLTSSNPSALGLEFDSDETIDHFHTSWWSSFHDAVDRGKADAGAMIDGKRAIAFGVLGLDCAHDCSSEMHPVFALAINVSNDPNDDVWAFFVRNWGNEGYCSSGTEHLVDSISTFTFTLPHPGALKAETIQSEFLSRGLGASGPFVDTVPGVGANVTFGFPRASERERMNGILHLKWTGPRPPTARPQINRSAMLRALASVQASGPEEPESRAWLWKELMTPEQRAIYERFRPKHDKGIDNIPPRRAVSLRPIKHEHMENFIRQTPDQERDRRDAQEFEAIKRAYNGHPPPF